MLINTQNYTVFLGLFQGDADKHRITLYFLDCFRAMLINTQNYTVFLGLFQGDADKHTELHCISWIVSGRC